MNDLVEEQRQIFERWAAEEKKIRRIAAEDLAMLEGDSPDPSSLSAARLRAAYALASERILDKLIALDARFRHFGCRIPEGVSTLPFSDAKPVAPGAIGTLVAHPQRTFKALYLVFDPDNARYFDVLDIRVGPMTVFEAFGRVPASLFTRENHIFGFLAIPKIEICQDFIVQVENKSSVMVRPVCSVFGVSTENYFDRPGAFLHQVVSPLAGHTKLDLDGDDT